MAARGSVRGVNRSASGFTLIELLAVILIIGILMAMILGVVAYAHRANLEAKTKADIETIRTALVNYQMDVGTLPPGPTWTTNLASYIRDGFTFLDPWGQAYRYIPSANRKSYKLYSKGTDRAESPPPEADADNIIAGKF